MAVKTRAAATASPHSLRLGFLHLRGAVKMARSATLLGEVFVATLVSPLSSGHTSIAQGHRPMGESGKSIEGVPGFGGERSLRAVGPNRPRRCVGGRRGRRERKRGS